MPRIPLKETLTIEFKSDKKKYPDTELVEALVAFANTEGGNLYLGVEDNGEVTGLHSSHQNADTLAAFVANKTIPPISVRTEKILYPPFTVLKISVPQYRNIVATSSGKLLRRRLKLDGTPENIPMYPYEIASRLSDLSLLDFSAQPVPDSTTDDFDPLERNRLRTLIQTYHGEERVLELDDQELDNALRFTTSVEGTPCPTLTGLLLIGKKARLRKLVPTAESAIQVMEGTTVKVNESFTLPLLAALEKISEYFNAWNPEEEIEDDLFRMAVPHYDKRAFREALINAFCHRDYSMLGRVRVLINQEGLLISNPGGFIEGITYKNLIDAEPHGRNPVLSDCLKRIGLAERTGRGIDRIFEGSLKYGKPLPDYSQSTPTMVKVFIPNALPDKAFIAMLLQEQKEKHFTFSIYSLFILNALKKQPRMQSSDLMRTLALDKSRLQVALESLVEAGLIESIGHEKSRAYILSAKVYKAAGNISGYIHQKDISEVRYPELILTLLQKQKEISRQDVADLLHITPAAAYRLLQKLRKQHKIVLDGKGRSAKYILPSS